MWSFTSGSDLDPGLGPIEGLEGGVVSFSYVSDKVMLLLWMKHSFPHISCNERYKCCI